MRKLFWIAVAGGFLVSWHYIKKLDSKGPHLIQGPELIVPTEITATEAHAKGTPDKYRLNAKRFSPEDTRGFAYEFEEKLKPAVEKWCQAFDGHVPFSAGDLSLTNLVERVGSNSNDFHYIFVLEGVTLGVSAAKAFYEVTYLNAGRETGKLLRISTNGPPPITKTPITPEETQRILNSISSRPVELHEIRITPTGLSGNLNGGAYVDVGGDPENVISWRYDMVFGPDGKLIYYLADP